MDVVEEDPMPLPVAHIQLLLCYYVLALYCVL
jgi:hypothetical protein